MQKRLFGADRSAIIALDVAQIGDACVVAKSVRGVPKIGGFKLGFELAFEGLATATSEVRRAYGSATRIIYDHQKAGNDIEKMGARFAKKMRLSGVDAAILFPFVGPASMEAWVKALQDEGVHILVGFVMTHPQFFFSEGGSLYDAAVMPLFDDACELGVTDFVVPGNKTNWIEKIRGYVERHISEGGYSLSAPGLITQLGDITEAGDAAGPRFQAIVGEAVYGQRSVEAMHNAAKAVTSKL